MLKKSTQYLYSTNASIAYLISDNFFGGKHFVWCSPVFNPKDCDDLDIHKRIPHSSSPHGIYSRLTEDINTNDLHSSKVQEIKAGLNKGAGIKLADGIIDDSQFRRIIEMIENATLVDFKPLIYIINKSKIKAGRLISVSVKASASPLSTEYQIHDLGFDEFDVIKF